MISQIDIDEATSGNSEVEPAVSLGDVEKSEKVDTINNQVLLEKGIKDDTPEILAITEFQSMYEKVPGSRIKNSNFDFMLFQNQFDLIVKEVINRKIEADPDLKQRIIEKYRQTMSDFSTTKSNLESFYLEVVNFFELLDIQENTISKLKTQIDDFNQDNSRSQNRNISAKILGQARTLGFEFNEEYLSNFLSSHAPDQVDTAFKRTGNVFYRSLVEFIYNSLFDFPRPSFENTSPPNFNNISMSISSQDDIQNLASEIAIASRGLFTNLSDDTGSNSRESSLLIEYLDDPENALIGKLSFQDFSAFGKSLLGDKNNLSSGNSKLINQANLYTVDNKEVQVYNFTIDNTEPIFLNGSGISNLSSSKITGNQYFSKDLSSRILEGNVDSADIIGYADKQITEISKLESFLENLHNSTTTGFFNGFIKEVASAANKAFMIDKMTTDLSSFSVNGNEVLGALTAINFISNNFEKLEVRRQSFIGLGERNVLSIKLYNEDLNIEEFVHIDLNKSITSSERYINQQGAHLRFPFNEVSVDSSSFQSIKNNEENSLISVKINGGFTGLMSLFTNGLAYLDPISNFLDEIKKSEVFQSNYLSGLQVYKISLKVLGYLLRGFIANTDYQINSSGGFDIAINKKGLELFYIINDLIERENIFENRLTQPFSNKIIGKNRPDSSFVKNRVENIYRQTTYLFFASYNIVKSLNSYFFKLKNQVSRIGNSITSLNEQLSVQDFSLDSVGIPTIERLTNLNHFYKSIFSPTTSFSKNNSYFPYMNTRTSSDLIALNSFHKLNPLDLSSNSNNEGMRIAAVGIPDGLINKLRLSSGRTNNHSIIEISLLTLDHKLGNDGETAKFTCRYKFLFNSCLHVSTLNSDINLLTSVLDENSTIKDFLNIDDREGFESFDLNEKDLFSFSFGRMENKQFLLDTKTSFDEAITYNRTRYQISSNTSFVGGPEYTFNSAMSGKIVKNHAINYILKKNFEIFAGTSLNEARFSYFDRSFINTPTQESESLVNYFNQQDYSDDLKDYLTRTSITSPIINPERYLIPSYGISSFERVFLLPCFKPRPEANFSFKSLIPVVRLL